MSPGKARLATGICCVGTLVAMAGSMLFWDAARAVFPITRSGAAAEYLAILGFFAGAALSMLPFDLVGGIVIPASLEARPLRLNAWLIQWFRSVGILSLFFSVTFFIYLQIGRQIGAPWLIAMFAVLQTTLLAGQELVWQTMTANWPRTAPRGRTLIVNHSDQRFAGGITGLPGLETILVPRDWSSRLSASSLFTMISRRRDALNSGGRLRGIIFAMFWNIAGFTFAILAVRGAINSVADLVTVYLWFLLSSFAGLLILPALNRRSVFALDRYFTKAHSHLELREAIAEVDRLTEQDPTRSPSAESVFQPIPCPEPRSRALVATGTCHVAAWNVARMALFLSWAFGGPLARAVHCNVGRPELWAIMPTD